MMTFIMKEHENGFEGVNFFYENDFELITFVTWQNFSALKLDLSKELLFYC